MPEDAVDKPIYESSEGPLPKSKAPRRGNSKTGKSGANVLLSGESFGVNPLRSMQGMRVGESKNFQGR